MKINKVWLWTLVPTFFLLALGFWFAITLDFNGHALGRDQFTFNNSVDAEKAITKAINQSDPSVCGKITLVWSGIGVTTSEIRSACYGDYIAAHPTTNICPADDADCVIEYAVLANQPTACLPLLDVRMGNYCVGMVAANTHDRKVCDLLPINRVADCIQYYSEYATSTRR